MICPHRKPLLKRLLLFRRNQLADREIIERGTFSFNDCLVKIMSSQTGNRWIASFYEQFERLAMYDWRHFQRRLKQFLAGKCQKKTFNWLRINL